MKNSILILTLAFFVLYGCKNNNSSITADSSAADIAEEIAGMSSMVVSYKTTMQSEGMKSVISSIQWIDMKNDRFATEMLTETEMAGTKTKESSLLIQTDGWEYILKPDEKTGIKMKGGETEDGDPTPGIKPENEETFRQVVEKEGGKIAGNETLLGKNCIVVEMIQEGETAKMWYYKGIPLKMISNGYVMEATKIEENVTIPESRFQVPAGFNIAEMPLIP